MARSRRIAVEEGSGNVFADLGFKNPEEELLRDHVALVKPKKPVRAE
jgi:hypothetical protein